MIKYLSRKTLQENVFYYVQMGDYEMIFNTLISPGGLLRTNTTTVVVVMGEVEHESDGNTSSSWNGLQRSGKRPRELDIRGRIQSPALLKPARILRRVLKTCCHLDFSENTPIKTGVKKNG